MSAPIRVQVTVDTDELREWAGKHADAGHHGVAHVLYQAASDGESLTEQAIREAERRGRDAVLAEVKGLVGEMSAVAYLTLTRHRKTDQHDGSESRVHNHPPDPNGCLLRRVGDHLRGACLNDDGSDRA